ncbi:MAG: RNA polymerase factor sigma-54, partial [Candidatus Competibacteraceae bacterium]|nr:RNA polymerase factor sigma-54 [Candidatus Competibacteraceae bacterium]
MRQSLQLRLGQQLTMTPQLQQAIRLLQLSSLDLQTEIQAVLESNLMLEPGDESGEPPAEAPEPANENQTSAESEMDLGSADKLPDELPVDSAWDDLYDASYDGTTSYSKGEDDDQRDFYERHNSGGETLRQHLQWQLELTPFSERDMTIAEAIVDAIGADGYLGTPLEEIYEGLRPHLEELEFDEVEAVLHRVQRFDPPGVAARHPGECLLLQLEQLPPTTSRLTQARELITHHLESLAGRDFNLLMRRLRVSREELQEIIALIQTLEPYPGSQFEAEPPQYVVPDV